MSRNRMPIALLLILKLAGRRDGDSMKLTLSATQGCDEISTSGSFVLKDVMGGVSLLSEGPGDCVSAIEKTQVGHLPDPAVDMQLPIGLRTGSGYGMVEFNKDDGTAKISMYRLGNEDEMFSGFPKTIKVGDKPSSKP